MEPITDNMQKYENYREQMGRLSRALKAEFYLEAIFIEYAILEDRLESALRHGGRWDPKPGKFVSLAAKVHKIEAMAREPKSLASKYFSPSLTDGVLAWKDRRNTMIHALLKQSLHTEDLRELAEEGQALVKAVNTKTSAFNRATEPQKSK